jgi:hypothetical protein
MRPVNLVLGLGLGVVWMAGLRAGVEGWIVWLDFAVALAALAVALIPSRAPGVIRAADTSFGVVLLALWLLALAVGVVSWMAWWTFAFGVAFLFGAVGAPGIYAEIGRPSHPSRA